jgi:hypothetical protein
MNKDEHASVEPTRQRHCAAPLVAKVVNAALQLTDEERQLINNFRAMKSCAKEMLVDLSSEYRRTLPAVRVHLTLVAH